MGGPDADFTVVDAPPGTPDAPPGTFPDAAPGSCGVCPVTFNYPAAGATTVELRGSFAADGWTAGKAMTLSGDHFTTTLSLPHGRTVQYKFVVDGMNWKNDPAATAAQVSDGFGGQNSALVADCGCAPLAFDWRDARMYFVMLDRFANGDSANDSPLMSVETPANFEGGDLAGLRAKIDSGYFDALGVNVIWISSPLDATESTGVGDDGHVYSAYHGYWPRDLEAVERRAGTLEDLVGVVDAAHRRGIRVVMDYVMNHVHQDSPIYAMHPDWFWPLQENGHDCVCGVGCSWDPPEGKRCWFRSYLPDFNFTVAAARAWSVQNATDWIKKSGVDGFRLDAVKHIETSWITDLRAKTSAEVEFGGHVFYMIGETFTGDVGLIGSYVNPQTMLNGQFDFPLRANVVRILLERQGSMSDLAGFLSGNDKAYAAGAIMGTFLGNHDLPRAIHLAEDTPEFGEWDSGKARAWANQPQLPGNRAPFERLATGFALIMTSPGLPLVYYGDEIGMAGGGDPDNRRPMQWSGISADQSWLRDQVTKLFHIRADHSALRRGGRNILGSSNDALVYTMSDGTETITVALNRGDGATSAPGLPAGNYHDLLSGTDVSAPLTIAPRSAMILVPR